MSFAEVASLNFDDANDVTWDLSFEVWNATSETNTAKFISGVRAVGSQDQHPLNPILAAKLDLAVYDESRTLHDKILNNNNQDIRITVKKDSTVWHRGLLNNVQNGDQVSLENPKLDLSFDDGLTYLKSLTWDEQGRAELLSLLAHILTQNTRTDLTTRVALAWKDANAGSSVRKSRALQHDLDRQHGSGSYWDVLVQTLRFYNLQVFQEDGRWYVLHRSYRDPDQSYEWEEEDSSKTESTGSTDPTVSLANTDWYQRPLDNEWVRRPTVNPDGWKASYRMAGRDWLNSDFTSDVTETISGNTVPEGWYLTNGANFDTTNNDVFIDATQGGIGTSTPEYIEQVLDKRVQRTSAGNFDQFDLTISGEVDMDADTESDNDIVIGELAAIDKDGDEFYYDNDAGNWNSSQTYIRNVVNNPSSGTSTENFKTDITGIPAPDKETDNDEVYYIRVRLYIEGDPDSDGFDEVISIRWQTVDLKNFQEHADRDVDNAVTYEMQVQGNVRSERFQIGSDQRDNSTGGIRYDTGNNQDEKWEILHYGSGGFTHAGRSYSAYEAEAARLRDKYSMFSQQLFRLIGRLGRSTLKLRDTAKFKSQNWVPHFREQSIRKEKVRMGLTQLRNDDETGATINEFSGADDSKGLEQVTGTGASGTSSGGVVTGSAVGTALSTEGGGGNVTSVQQRTGSVEFAAEDVDATLAVDTSADPNQIGIADGGVDTAQLAADAVTSAKIASGAVGDTELANPYARTDQDNSFSGHLQTTDGDFTSTIGAPGNSNIFTVEIDDTAGTQDTIVWIRNRSTSPPEAFNVRNQSDGNNLFVVWDGGDAYVHNRLGVGTTSAAYAVDAVGKVNASNGLRAGNGSDIVASKPSSSDSGSVIRLASPAGYPGITFIEGDGSGGPQHRWDIWGEGSDFVIRDNDAAADILRGNASKIDFAPTVSFLSNAVLGDNSLRLRTPTDSNHALRWAGSGNAFAGAEPDGPALYGYTDGLLGTRTAGSGEAVAVYWTANLQVALGGGTSPAYACDVNGVARAQTRFQSDEIKTDTSYTQGLFGDGYILQDDGGDGQSYFEVDNARFRGTLRVHIFKKDIIRATNALLYVSDAAETTEDVTTPGSTGNAFTLYVKQGVFDANDEITFKDEVSGGSILQVVGTVSTDDGTTTRNGQTVHQYTVTLNSGTSTTIPGGSTVVRTSGARVLHDAATSDAPQVTMWDQNGNIRQAYGNLNGRYDYTSATFGLAAGDPSTEWLAADASNGIRMVDSSTVRAQLSSSTLTLGATSEDHTLIDPTSLRMVGSGGTTRAELNGSSLTLGDTSDPHIVIDPATNGMELFDSTGSRTIHFDTAGDVFIEDTLEMGAGGRIDNANDDFWITDTGFHVRQGDSAWSAEYSYSFGTDENARIWQESGGAMILENDDGPIQVGTPGTTFLGFDASPELLNWYGVRSTHPSDQFASGVILYILDGGTGRRELWMQAGSSTDRIEIAAVDQTP